MARRRRASATTASALAKCRWPRFLAGEPLPAANCQCKCDKSGDLARALLALRSGLNNRVGQWGLIAIEQPVESRFRNDGEDRSRRVPARSGQSAGLLQFICKLLDGYYGVHRRVCLKLCNTGPNVRFC